MMPVLDQTGAPFAAQNPVVSLLLHDQHIGCDTESIVSLFSTSFAIELAAKGLMSTWFRGTRDHVATTEVPEKGKTIATSWKTQLLKAKILS